MKNFQNPQKKIQLENYFAQKRASFPQFENGEKRTKNLKNRKKKKTK